MSAHCKCGEHERVRVETEVSPNHFDGESWIVECGNCGGLIHA